MLVKPTCVSLVSHFTGQMAQHIHALVVNYIGCASVLDNLQTSYLASYLAAPFVNFTSPDGEVSGYTKSASKDGKGSGNVAFVAFHNAGHMVPHDDPEGALRMVGRWLKNEPLAVAEDE